MPELVVWDELILYQTGGIRQCKKVLFAFVDFIGCHKYSKLQLQLQLLEYGVYWGTYTSSHDDKTYISGIRHPTETTPNYWEVLLQIGPVDPKQTKVVIQ